MIPLQRFPCAPGAPWFPLFPLPGPSNQNSPRSFQIESQLPEIRAQCRVSGYDARIESKSDETKTLFRSHSCAARGRWIVARLVGLACECAATNEHGHRLRNDSRFGIGQRRFSVQGFPDAANSWSKQWPRVRPTQSARTARASSSESAIYRFYSRATSPVRSAGARPRRVAGRVWPCATTRARRFSETDVCKSP